VVSGFDVQVANNVGRTGVGIDAFTITVGHGANACVIQALPAGISLVGSLTGTPLANAGSFGTAIRAVDLGRSGVRSLVARRRALGGGEQHPALAPGPSPLAPSRLTWIDLRPATKD
jgi:hypothetical protein